MSENGDGPPAKRQAKVQVTELQRGGVIVHTRIGDIQVGIPCETIKESMKTSSGVPTMFVAPKEMWNCERGITLCEFEFPAYFNFFIKKRQTIFVCTEAQRVRIRAAFKETLLGPGEVNLDQEFLPGHLVDARPSFRKEGDYFRRIPGSDKLLDIDTLVTFVVFDDNGRAKLEDGIAIQAKENTYDVLDGESVLYSAPAIITLPKRTELPSTKVFEPPLFGVTILGSSHGFDPDARTTGMVIWINRKGILVDPPIFVADILRSYGITPPQITHLIVTHCHGDHDSGAFQKILDEHRITVITTNTILGSFVRKYSALSGMSVAKVRSLFTFQPVRIGEGVKLHGADIHFRYNFHPIPTIGIEVYFAGESLIYSSDTFNCPEVVSKLAAEGLMSEGRRDFLNAFPWHHSVVIHEAGVPPIHTPMETFTALSEDIQKRLYLVHCSDASVPDTLKKAVEGAENTIVIDVPNPARAEAIEILDCLESIEIFQSLDIRQCRDVLEFVRVEEYNKGDVIIREGDTNARTFYVIMRGIVSIQVAGRTCNASMYPGDFFGEMGLVENKPRSASATAETHVKVLVFHKREFLHMLRDLNKIDRLRHLADIRRSECYQAIQGNTHLAVLTAKFITALEQELETRTFEKDQVVFRAGDQPAELLAAVLIKSGSLQYTAGSCAPKDAFKRGAFVGDFDAMIDDNACTSTLIATEPTTGFTISRDSLVRLCREFPGVGLALRKQYVLL